MDVDTTKQLEPQHKKYSSSKITVKEKKAIKNMVTKRSSKVLILDFSPSFVISL